MIYKFCPDCGESCSQKDFKTYECTKCKRHWFDQPVPAAAAFVLNKNREILFGIRKREPWKGLLTLPGGFLDNNESLEAGCLREIEEECGLQVSKLIYFGSYPDIYEYRDFIYKSTVAFFVAEKDSELILNDVEELDQFFWLKPQDIDLKKVQGGCVNIAVRDFLELELAKHR